MTENEFKMCCALFCKTFEGKKYGEIVKCYYERSLNPIITNTFKFEDNGLFLNLILDEYLILYFVRNSREMFIARELNNKEFDLAEDFLNYFNISLKDII